MQKNDREMTTKEAMERAGVYIGTIRNWCVKYRIGRKRGGRWIVNRIAFENFLIGREFGDKRIRKEND